MECFRSSFSQVLAGSGSTCGCSWWSRSWSCSSGLLIALIRTARGPALFPLRMIAVVYVDVMRGVPTILWSTCRVRGPALILSGLPTGAAVLGGIALGLCYSAYVSEVFRAGIESIHPSQAGAALALGLTQSQALRHVVLPQAVRRVVPPLLNDFISLQKDVALISILGHGGVSGRADLRRVTFNYTPLIAAALLYLCVTIPLTRIIDRFPAARSSASGAACSRWAEMSAAVLELRGVTKAYGEHEVLAGSTSRSASTRRSR